MKMILVRSRSSGKSYLSIANFKIMELVNWNYIEFLKYGFNSNHMYKRYRRKRKWRTH